MAERPKSRPPPRAFIQQKRAETGYHPGSPVPQLYDPIPASNGGEHSAARDIDVTTFNAAMTSMSRSVDLGSIEITGPCTLLTSLLSKLAPPGNLAYSLT